MRGVRAECLSYLDCTLQSLVYCPVKYMYMLGQYPRLEGAISENGPSELQFEKAIAKSEAAIALPGQIWDNLCTSTASVCISP